MTDEEREELRATLRVLVEAAGDGGDGFALNWPKARYEDICEYECESCIATPLVSATIDDHKPDCPLAAAIRHARKVIGE